MSTSITGLASVSTLATSDILAGDVSGVTKSITAGNLRKAFFGFAAADPLNCGALTATGASTITGTLGGITTLTCSTLVASSITANVTGNVTGSSGSCTGNAATATAVAGSGLTGTTLAASVVTSSLTTIGTLVAGAVPASLVTAGTFGAGAYSFPAGLTVASGFTLTAGPITFSAGTTKIAVPAGGFTDFRLASDAGSALLIADTGSVQVSNGTLTTRAGVTAGSSLRIPHGAAPTSPVDGDVWSTTTTLNFRLNGVTKSVTLT